MPTDRYHLRFQNAEAPDTTEIADFLFLFRATYAAAVSMPDMKITAATPEGAEQFALKLRTRLSSLGARQLGRLFYQNLGENQLLTKHISEESPLEVVLEGIAIAMAAAVIISGGSFRAVGILEVQLPPLGDGIKKLRGALAGRTKSQLAFGIRPRRIKLSQEEVRELFRLDRSQREHGGFQRFLVGLQDRINRQSGILELSEADIDFILRHGRESHKGGFQARIRKIFDRHFSFD